MASGCIAIWELYCNLGVVGWELYCNTINCIAIGVQWLELYCNMKELGW